MGKLLYVVSLFLQRFADWHDASGIARKTYSIWKEDFRPILARKFS